MESIDVQSEQGFSPRIEFNVLSARQILDVHEASLRVLDETGVRVISDEGMAVLRKAGAPIDHENIVRIHPALVEAALKTAPGSVRLYSRDGQPSLLLEEKKLAFRSRIGLPLYP